MCVSLSKALASSKLGVPDVLANLLGLLARDPEILCFGCLCVAFMTQKKHHARVLLQNAQSDVRNFVELVQFRGVQDNPYCGGTVPFAPHPRP